MQPPSGGCVLKLLLSAILIEDLTAATFGWLCVETCSEFVDLLKADRSHLRVAVC